MTHPATTAWQRSQQKCATCTHRRVAGPAWRCAIEPKGVQGARTMQYCIDATARDGACGPQTVNWEAAS
jgi:hypothetical protein